MQLKGFFTGLLGDEGRTGGAEGDLEAKKSPKCTALHGEVGKSGFGRQVQRCTPKR